MHNRCKHGHACRTSSRYVTFHLQPFNNALRLSRTATRNNDGLSLSPPGIGGKRRCKFYQGPPFHCVHDQRYRCTHNFQGNAVAHPLFSKREPRDINEEFPSFGTDISRQCNVNLRVYTEIYLAAKFSKSSRIVSSNDSLLLLSRFLLSEEDATQGCFSTTQRKFEKSGATFLTSVGERRGETGYFCLEKIRDNGKTQLGVS